MATITCVSVRRARRWLRVRPGLRFRRQSRVAPGIRKPGTSSRTCERPTDHRSPPTRAHPTRPIALRTTRQALYPAELRARPKGKLSYYKGNPASTAFQQDPLFTLKKTVVCAGFAACALPPPSSTRKTNDPPCLKGPWSSVSKWSADPSRSPCVRQKSWHAVGEVSRRRVRRQRIRKGINALKEDGCGYIHMAKFTSVNCRSKIKI